MAKKKKSPPARDLLSALEARDLDKVKALLDEGADPNASLRELPMLVHAFAGDSTRDDPEPVALLLDAGADIEKAFERASRNPLSEAALQGKTAVCELLLERGADIRFAKNGRGVLHAASQSGLLWLVDKALKAGADPGVADSKGETPLHDASYAGRLEVAERLIAAGASVNAVITSGKYKDFTPLRFAVLGGFPRLTELLLERGAAIDPKDHPLAWLLRALAAEEDYGRTQRTAPIPLEVRVEIAAMIVARVGDNPFRPSLPDDPFVKVAEVLLNRGRPIPEELHDAAKGLLNKNRSAEYKGAIRRDDARAVIALLKDRVPPPGERSLLRMAADKGAVAVTRALLEAGEDPNDFDPYEGTPLHAAVRSKKHAIVEILLDAGCDVERWTEPEGQELPESPLWLACAGGDRALVKLLLDRGASPGIAAKLPKDLWDFLAEVGCLPICEASDPKILALLLEHGADPNAGNPLHRRLEDGDVEGVRLLLEAGADPNAKGMDGELPLLMALEQESADLVELLLKYGANFGKQKPPPGLSAAQKGLLAKHGVEPAGR